MAKSRLDIFSSAGCNCESRQGSRVITNGSDDFSNPGFCSSRINIEVMLGKDLCQPCDNPRLISHEETQVPWTLKIGTDSRCRDVTC